MALVSYMWMHRIFVTLLHYKTSRFFFKDLKKVYSLLQFLCVALLAYGWPCMQKIHAEGFWPAGLHYDVVYILSLQVHAAHAGTCSLHSLAKQKQS